MPQAWALLGDTGTPTGGLDKWDSDMDPASDGREICGSRVRGWKDGKRIDLEEMKGYDEDKYLIVLSKLLIAIVSRTARNMEHSCRQ